MSLKSYVICAPGEHVPEIERKIRTVKERKRASALPFRIMPPIIIGHATIFSFKWLNPPPQEVDPTRSGISNTLSPQEIVTGLKPNTSKHCKIPFGGYAQVHAESSQGNNAMVSRTVGAISLGPVGNIEGPYKFMSLLTGKLIKGRSFTPLPMPENVITQVEGMASDDTNERRQLTQNKRATMEEDTILY
jgi:hypothetical protein